MREHPVTVSSQSMIVQCFTQQELLQAMRDLLPSHAEGVELSITYMTVHGNRALSLTYEADGTMYETYGSRQVLDEQLLLSRIHWSA